MKRVVTAEDVEYRDVMIAMRDVAAATELIGIPGRAVGNVGVAFSDVLEGQHGRALAETIGYSPYRAERKFTSEDAP